MKTLLNILLIFFWSCTAVFAQIPEMINYQAIARDANGNLLADRAVTLRLSLLEGSASGSAVYTETHAATTNSYGLFTLKIGDGTTTSGDFSTIDWGANSHFLQVELDPNGGSAYAIIGTSQLVSVPYALTAKTVEQESQELNLAGNLLSITSGNSVNLNSVGPWSTSGTTITTSASNINLGTNGSAARLTVRSDMWMLDATSSLKMVHEVASNGAARSLWYGPNGNDNVRLTWISGAEDNGFIVARNSSGVDRASLYSSSSNTGAVRTYGPNNNQNASLSWLSGTNNHGYIAARDAGGNVEAGIYVNASGSGIVFGDTKNFRMEHPTQPDLEIWYASLEGPEAAAYERGTGTLINGKASITFSDHFQMVCDDEKMTVVLTPLSGKSKGLAVIRKSASGFEVTELMGGKGNYSFDWEVKAVRTGYEDYKVIRHKRESTPGDDLVSDVPAE